jgi:hypothetical protein
MSRYCLAGVKSGLVKLQGPISQQIINEISVNASPCTISFAPRTVAPTLVGSLIDELTDNTCTYKGVRYTLIQVQICQVMHSGYSLPNMTNTPSAELFITYGNQNSPINYPKGIVFSFPIFQTTAQPKHGGYLAQLVDSNAPVANLQTLFYDDEKDTSQSSISYITCYEYMSGDVSDIGSLAVFVFPHGTEILSQNYQSLIQLLPNKTLLAYQLPPALREGNPTVLSYTFDEDGNKKSTLNSDSGVLYTTQILTSSSDFIHNFEYFTRPPRLPGKFTESCPYYKKQQYKCIPFDKLKNLQGDYVVMNGVSLDKVLEQQDNNIQSAKKPDIDINTSVDINNNETFIATVAGITIAAGILIFTGSMATKYL